MKRTPGGAVFLSCLLLANLIGAQDAPKLFINIVEGEGALNNVKQRVNREPIVQVEDENHRPVAGATVTFLLPSDGPGGSFANGASTLVRTTSANGQTSMSLQPNQIAGQ